MKVVSYGIVVWPFSLHQVPFKKKEKKSRKKEKTKKGVPCIRQECTVNAVRMRVLLYIDL